MIAYRRYRFRNRVLSILEFIFRDLGPRNASKVFKLAFPTWKTLIGSYYEEYHDKPAEAAAMLALMSLRHLVWAISDDHRSLALYAMKTNNSENVTANNLRNIIGMIRIVGKNEVIYKSAMFEVAGALQGMSAEELDAYRTRGLLNEAMSGLLKPYDPNLF